MLGPYTKSSWILGRETPVVLLILKVTSQKNPSTLGIEGIHGQSFVFAGLVWPVAVGVGYRKS